MYNVCTPCQYSIKIILIYSISTYQRTSILIASEAEKELEFRDAHESSESSGRLPQNPYRIRRSGGIHMYVCTEGIMIVYKLHDDICIWFTKYVSIG